MRDVTISTNSLVYMEDESTDRPGDKSPHHVTLRELLRTANLLQYESALLQHGADDVEQLRYLENGLFDSLCDIVGLNIKPLHLLRFKKALGRDVSRISLVSKNDIVSRSHLGSLDKTVAQVSLTSFVEQSRSRCVVNSSASSSVTISTTSSGFPIAPAIIPTTSQNLARNSVPSSIVNSFASGGSDSQSSLTMSDLAQNRASTSVSFPEIPSLQTFNLLSHNGSLQASTVEPPSARELSDDESSERTICLPAYLHPKSNTSDFSQLVDSATPIQQNLDPSPISPFIWDQKRADLIRNAAAIYGRKTNSRKSGELTSHEANVNEASAQLCLRDPTLLVRREELFILSRRAVREGGFSYVHGFSRSKHAGTSRSGVENSEEGMSVENGTPKSVRERRKQRLEELERLIGRNKDEQGTKMSALDQAQDVRDFSLAFQLQTEIEALGNVCLTLETEYNQLKRRQKRSDRYFESKAKRPAVENTHQTVNEDVALGTRLIPATHPNEHLLPSSLPSDRLVPLSHHNDHLIPSSHHNDHVIPSSSSADCVIPSCPSTDHLIPSSHRSDHLIPSSHHNNHLIPSSSSTDRVIPSSPSTDHLIPSSHHSDHLIPSSNSSDHLISSQSCKEHLPPSHSESFSESQLSSALMATGRPSVDLQETQLFEENPNAVNSLVSLVTEVTESTNEFVDEFLAVSSANSES